MDQQAVIALFALAIGLPSLVVIPVMLFLLRVLHDIERRLTRIERNGKH